MKNHGIACVSEFLGDRIVYRNLAPVDPRLPTLDQLRSAAGLAEGVIPRKSQPQYARVIVHMLQAARALDAPGTSLQRLVYVGDTRLNDGTAFANICRAGGWPGMGFIGADREPAGHIDILPAPGEPASGGLATVYDANRWAALPEFDAYLRRQGFPVNKETAVIVDLDKTAVGARGRNDQVIDGARVEAVRRTVGHLLGEGFDAQAFQRAYDLLNQQAYHPFTADNQDYLAYICLILGSGLDSLEQVVEGVHSGRLASFQSFIAGVDDRAAGLSPELREIHTGIYARVQAGDPTPFKAFRYAEYLATIERMGCCNAGEPVEEMLAGEIVLTQEVRQVALDWQARGAVVFGLSDKPDEASIPSESQAAQGLQPIHRALTHAIGE